MKRWEAKREIIGNDQMIAFYKAKLVRLRIDPKWNYQLIRSTEKQLESLYRENAYLEQTYLQPIKQQTV